MHKQFVGAMLAGLAAVSAAPALAQSQAFTSTTVNLYAGPAGDYPVVAQVPGGVSLAVMGCVAGYSWCDVSLPGLRGWVYGGYLTYPYQGARVPLMNYGSTIGLPIVTFSLGAYWGNYYRDRPWYGNQSHWYRHPGPRPGPPPAIRPPVRPPAHGARPPGGHHGNRPGNGHGHDHRPPNPGARPPGHGGAKPPGHGGARPPGNSGGRPPGQGGRPPGGGNNRPPGGGGHHGNGNN
ncbi:SH3 domain-containing protein [Paraburkholderia sp. J63]|uniref:SH3 domain-containing protein n=1 Tax=Paraburkholderia sp. J63 TaxID=2805434 RepID=UPI002ABD8877|nr:SH3 domain-containing protein [Paraburkholderia sp. J63]